MSDGGSNRDQGSNRPIPAGAPTVRHQGGLESKLDAAAWIQLVLGLLFALGLLVFTGGKGIVVVMLVALNSWLAWLVLRAVAEIIRLQKKANGLPYGGRISEATAVIIEKCPSCGAVLYSDDRCERCGNTRDREK